LPWLILSWGLLGGGVALLLAALAIFVYAWLTGAHFRIAGGGAPPPAPMSIQAAVEALPIVYLVLVFFGLPAFAIGWIVGVIVALVKWANKRKGTSASPLIEVVPPNV